jgi:hypothetical protein
LFYQITKKLMKKLKITLSIALMGVLISCGGSENKSGETTSGEAPKSMVADPPNYDPNRGEGKWTTESLGLKEELDETWVSSGESIAGVKCTSCHKTTEEKLVGPGWKGVTSRRTPEWIMNFITNPDPMIDKDPEVQAQLELCLVRMPNQSLSDAEARNILEFMRKNDKTK